MPGDNRGGDFACPAKVVFTICAANYLAQASILATSLAQHHPGQRLVVFLIDDAPAGISLPPTIDMLPANCVMEQAEWHHRQAHYTLLEFATCIKPACFRHLFQHGAACVTYLDPDIRFFAPMPELEAERGAPLLLTPHCLTPLPDDGCLPDNLGILRAGTYNLGFAQMRDGATTRAFLEWWHNALHIHCLEDHSSGCFTDQRWMDMAPVLVPGAEVSRHPGYNLAYWNMHERTPRLRAGRWHVEGPGNRNVPLVFCHFSGFHPDRANLSKHETRFGTKPPGDVNLLLAEYGQALRQAGHADCATLPSSPIRRADGVKWDPILRQLYRQACQLGLPLADPLVDDAFLTWIRENAPGDHLCRYLRMVLQLRQDMAAVYADGQDIAGLLAWLCTVGQQELGIDPALLEQIGLWRLPLEGGVNFVGYLRAQLGLGEASRSTISALQAAGVPVQGHDITWMTSSPVANLPVPQLPAQSRAPGITLLGCNADQLPDVLRTLPQQMLPTYRIGCWYWETPEFPEEWCDRFGMVDEVWAPTQFIADALRAKSMVPVVVVPLLVQPPQMVADRAWLGRMVPDLQDGEFLFLTQFDVFSAPFRKNPEAAIAAFVAAFQPTEPVRLLVKLLNGDKDPELMVRLRTLAAGHRVSLLDAALESDDRFRLLASSDCFVSLHRAEGFGLSIAEAMAYRRPVIVTNWSGNIDFTNETNAALVGYDLIRTERRHGAYPAGTVWANPRVAEAASQMRRMVDDQAWRDSIATAGAATIAEKFSAHAVGAAMLERLERVARSGKLYGKTPVIPSAPIKDPAAMGSGHWLPRRILLDAFRYPGYYLSRLPRLPHLIRQHGLKGLFQRIQAGPAVSMQRKGQYSLRVSLNSWSVDWKGVAKKERR